MSVRKRSAPSGTMVTSHVSILESREETDVFESEGLEDPPRRSKRVRAEIKVDSVADMEDIGCILTTFPTAKESKSTEASGSRSSSSKKVKGKAVKSKAKSIPQTLDSGPHPAPPHWKEVYEIMKKQRLSFVAPVDTMGCQLVQEGESDPRVSLQALFS